MEPFTAAEPSERRGLFPAPAPAPGPGSATLASIAGLCETLCVLLLPVGGVVSAAGATWATVTSGINEAFLHQNQRN